MRKFTNWYLLFNSVFEDTSICVLADIGITKGAIFKHFRPVIYAWALIPCILQYKPRPDRFIQTGHWHFAALYISLKIQDSGFYKPRDFHPIIENSAYKILQSQTFSNLCSPRLNVCRWTFSGGCSASCYCGYMRKSGGVLRRFWTWKLHRIRKDNLYYLKMQYQRHINITCIHTCGLIKLFLVWSAYTEELK